MQVFVTAHPVVSPCVFILIYAVATALSIPGALFLTLAGGFLFSFPLSALWVVIAATLGATAIFFSSKNIYGNLPKTKVWAILNQVPRRVLKKCDQLPFIYSVCSFVSFLACKYRLLAAWSSRMDIHLDNLSWHHSGSFVFTYAASSIHSIFDQTDSFSINDIFTFEIKIALTALGIFALLPILIKAIVKKVKKND